MGFPDCKNCGDMKINGKQLKYCFNCCIHDNINYREGDLPICLDCDLELDAS